MVKNIVILGGGTAGWMTAAWLSKHLDNINITLTESSDIPIIGVGESTVPPIVEFIRQLGIPEEEWMPECNATYKSSICFKDFYKTDDRRIWYPFEPVEILQGRPVNRYWLYKHRHDPQYSDRHSFYDYSYFVPDLCRQGKTVKSIANTPYAYHMDAGLFGQFLKGFSKKNGVTHVVDTITRVEQDEQGNVKCLHRENGDPLYGDLFVDCSGFRSLLVGDTLNEPFVSFSDYLFNDKAVAMRIPYEDKEQQMVSYTNCYAQSAGWVWTVPLYNRLGTGYVYASAYKSADEAEMEFRQHLGEDRVKDIDARHLSMKVGVQRRTWVKNCIAIGLSAGFVEPLESTALFTIQSGAQLIANILKTSNDYTVADVAAFNDSVTRLFEIIRDFLVCHYALTSREDSPFWQDVKYTTKISDTLSEKLRLARLAMPDREFFNQFDNASLAGFSFQDGWQCILTGMNYLPFDLEQLKRNRVGIYDPQIQANMPAADQRQERMASQRAQIAQLPSHYEWLRTHHYKGKD